LDNNGDTQYSMIGLRIRNLGRADPPEDSNVRWVKLDGDFLQMKNEDQIRAWLVHFGKILGPITPETYDFGMGGDDEDKISTGRLTVKMDLSVKIPQILPMFGQKVRVHYHGINKICLNCYKTGHMRVDCENEVILWLTYVSRFMRKFPDINPELYGKWVQLIKDEIMKAKIGLESRVVDEIVRDGEKEEKGTTVTEEDKSKEPTERVTRAKGKQNKEKSTNNDNQQARVEDVDNDDHDEVVEDEDNGNKSNRVSNAVKRFNASTQHNDPKRGSTSSRARGRGRK